MGVVARLGLYPLGFAVRISLWSVVRDGSEPVGWLPYAWVACCGSLAGFRGRFLWALRALMPPRLLPGPWPASAQRGHSLAWCLWPPCIPARTHLVRPEQSVDLRLVALGRRLPSRTSDGGWPRWCSPFPSTSRYGPWPPRCCCGLLAAAAGLALPLRSWPWAPGVLWSNRLSGCARSIVQWYRRVARPGEIRHEYRDAWTIWEIDFLAGQLCVATRCCNSAQRLLCWGCVSGSAFRLSSPRLVLWHSPSGAKAAGFGPGTERNTFAS